MTRKCSNPDLSSSKLHKTEFFWGEPLFESRFFVGLTLVNFVSFTCWYVCIMQIVAIQALKPERLGEWYLKGGIFLDFLSPFVHDLLETLASLISIDLDVKYFLFLSRDEICHIHCDSYGDGDVTLRQLWWRWCYIVTGAMCVKWTVVIAATQGGATQC